jgi:hypothetical protein
MIATHDEQRSQEPCHDGSEQIGEIPDMVPHHADSRAEGRYAVAGVFRGDVASGVRAVPDARRGQCPYQPPCQVK